MKTLNDVQRILVEELANWEYGLLDPLPKGWCLDKALTGTEFTSTDLFDFIMGHEGSWWGIGVDPTVDDIQRAIRVADEGQRTDAAAERENDKAEAAFDDLQAKYAGDPFLEFPDEPVDGRLFDVTIIADCANRVSAIVLQLSEQLLLAANDAKAMLEALKAKYPELFPDE